jgi:pyruvate formate lyase activating enzyme
MSEKGILVVRERCTLCGKCVTHCTSGAMTMVGEQIEAEEVVRRVVQDKPFYDESGGGVTLSGGEPLMQPEFSKAILSSCKAKGIHTALETNLMAPQEIIDLMLPVVDLWMCDIKTVDAEMHKKYTGAPNERILSNLNYLATKKVPIIVRTPVVPEFNDTQKAITAIYEQIKALPIKYELLEFHTLGFDKFNHLGMENPCEKMQPLSKEKLAILNDIIQQ